MLVGSCLAALRVFLVSFCKGVACFLRQSSLYGTGSLLPTLTARLYGHFLLARPTLCIRVGYSSNYSVLCPKSQPAQADNTSQPLPKAPYLRPTPSQAQAASQQQTNKFPQPHKHRSYRQSPNSRADRLGPPCCSIRGLVTRWFPRYGRAR